MDKRCISELALYNNMVVNTINRELLEILQNPRSERKTYRQYLEEIFVQYQQKLEQHRAEIEPYCMIAEPFEAVKNEVQESCKKLLHIYDLYMRGKIGEAVEDMDYSFMTSESIFLEELTQKEPMFRARTLEPNQGSYEVEEMFHVPFEKRGIISNNRYSIAGFPCLYVGKSILACWEEMHKPNIDNLCVSRVAITEFEKRYVIDLSWKEDVDGEIPEDEEAKSERHQQIITWIKRLPLIIACSIRAHDPSAPFKEEYVIPQLLLHASVDNKFVDGIAYTSTRRDEQIASDIELHKNYVFPVQEVAEEGYCSELIAQFVLTRGVSFMEADIKNVFHGRGIPKIDIEGETLCFGEIDAGKTEYECTKFGQMEEYLMRQPLYCIYKEDGEWRKHVVKQ